MCIKMLPIIKKFISANAKFEFLYFADKCCYIFKKKIKCQKHKTNNCSFTLFETKSIDLRRG